MPTEAAAEWLTANGFSRAGNAEHASWTARGFAVKPTSMGWQAWATSREGGGGAVRDHDLAAALRAVGWTPASAGEVTDG